MGLRSFFRGIFRKGAVSTSDWRNPQAWLVSALGGGGKTVSGESVTVSSALKLGVYFACARNLGEDVGGLPLVCYERKERGKRVADEQGVAWLLHDQPNPEMGAMTFRESLTFDAATQGHGLAEIERSGRGAPEALWPIHASRWIDMRRDEAGRLYHLIRADDVRFVEQAGTNFVTILDTDLLRVRGVGSGWRPHSVAQLAAESIGVGLAQEKARAALFGNGLMFGGFVEAAQTMNKEQREELRASLKERHGGAEKAHEIGMLPNGTKFVPNAIKPEEAQFVESERHSVESICRWFRMPVSMVMQTENPDTGTDEDRSSRYATWTLRPWCIRWEQEIMRKLFPARTRYFAEHVMAGIMRGSYTSRTTGYRTLITTGVLTCNEARELENLNPDPTPNADKLLIQGAMVPLEKAGSVSGGGLTEPGTGEEQPGGSPPGMATPDEPMPMSEPEKPAKKPTAMFRPVVEDACARACRKEAKAVANAERKCGRDARAFSSWATVFYGEHETDIVAAALPCFEGLGVPKGALAAYAARYVAGRRAAVTTAPGVASDPDGAAKRMAADLMEILG